MAIKNGVTMLDLHIEATIDINNEIEAIQQLVNDNPCDNYATLGNLHHVLSQLREITQFLSGEES